MEKTIAQIAKEFEEFATAHRQINDFFFESFLNVYESNRVQHCSLIVDINVASPGQGQNNTGNYYHDFSIQITVADKVYSDYRNYIDVKSDTYQYLNDVRNAIESPRWKNFGKVVSNPPATFFRENGGDVVDGWTVTIVFRVPDKRNLCAIPVVGYDFGLNS